MIIGKGTLSWARGERVSDRYGTVMLMLDGDAYVQFDDSLTGQHGTLAAVVIETRRSTHIGDLFRGLSPSTPEVDDTITLGTGTVFLERGAYGEHNIGLAPDEPRDSDWLDPNALYRLHEQTVQLTFTPTRK